MHENEFDDNIIRLKNEKGVEVPFEFLDVIRLNNGSSYLVLLPYEDDQDQEPDGTVTILEIEETEPETYVTVEDSELLEKVFSIFKNKWEDEFEFV